MARPPMMSRYYAAGLLGLGLTALLASYMSRMAGNVTAFADSGTCGCSQRRGVTAASEENGGADRWAEDAALASLAAASVQGALALGPRAGARIARYGRSAHP